LTQVAKNHFAFATALLWHWSFEITLKLYLYGKYSTQTIIFWSLCAFIWFKNMKKMLLQMTSGFLQLESSLPKVGTGCKDTLVICNSTFMTLVILNYFKTVLIWKIFNPNYDFLVPLCLYLVQKYEKKCCCK
jgi:hypothetical protein